MDWIVKKRALQSKHLFNFRSELVNFGSPKKDLTQLTLQKQKSQIKIELLHMKHVKS